VLKVILRPTTLHVIRDFRVAATEVNYCPHSSQKYKSFGYTWSNWQISDCHAPHALGLRENHLSTQLFELEYLSSSIDALSSTCILDCSVDHISPLFLEEFRSSTA
jgi:hypothetical protein